VRTLASTGALAAGTHALAWNGLSDRGTRLPAGKYLVRLDARTPGGNSASALTALEITP
jgi:hypothetical protein